MQVTGDPNTLDLLAQHLPTFFGGPGEVVAQARLDGADPLHVELPDGLSLSGPYGTETFRAAASRIELLIAAQLPDRVAVHAGVVAWQGRAIVLPGVSMSGKSTLVSALVDAGATYLSDEFALLDGSGRVWAYPRKMTTRTTAGTERRLPDGSAGVDDAGLEVALVADFTFSSDGGAVESMTRGQTVLSLAANALPIRTFPARTLDCLTAVATTAEGIRGVRGEAVPAAVALLARLSRLCPTSAGGRPEIGTLD